VRKLNIPDSEEVLAVIVNSSGISRAYWGGEYDPDNPQAPTCWSPDGGQPSPNVPEANIQSRRCMNCKQNIRGASGRACRFSQKLAVVLEDDLEEVHQLHVPASSIFGKNFEKPFHGLQEYAKLLVKHKTTSVALYTRIVSNCDGDFPVILFAPQRPLEEDEIDIVKRVIGNDDALEAIDTDAYTGDTNSESPFEVEEGFTQDAQLEN